MEDLVESILDYVRADYTDYAIMINGEWGSGKTYFWNNKIRNKIDSLTFNGKKYTTIYMSLYGISNLEEISKKMAFVLSDPESPKMTNHNNGKIVNFENIYNSVDKQENIDKGIIQKTMLSLIKNQQYEALLKGIEAAPEEFHELQAQMSNEQLQAIVSILPSSNSKVPLEHFLKNNPRLEAAFYEHCFKVFG